MSYELYDRRYKIEIHVGNSRALVIESNEEDPYKSLEISFDIEKNLVPSPNPGTIKIWNLSQETRNQLGGLRNARISLTAGYKEERTEIFTGGIFSVFSRPSPPDWITEIRARDGGTHYTTTRLQQSIQIKTSLQEAIQTGLKAAGVNVRVIKDLPEINFEYGIHMAGSLRRTMNQLTAAHGLTWSFQDEQIQVFQKGGNTGEGILLLTPDTGLVGAPSANLEIVAGAFPKTSVQFQALLNGAIRPGRRIKIDCQTLALECNLYRVKFSGQFSGQNWYAEGQSYI